MFSFKPPLLAPDSDIGGGSQPHGSSEGISKNSEGAISSAVDHRAGQDKDFCQLSVALKAGNRGNRLGILGLSSDANIEQIEERCCQLEYLLGQELQGNSQYSTTHYRRDMSELSRWKGEAKTLIRQRDYCAKYLKDEVADGLLTWERTMTLGAEPESSGLGQLLGAMKQEGAKGIYEQTTKLIEAFSSLSFSEQDLIEALPATGQIKKWTTADAEKRVRSNIGLLASIKKDLFLVMEVEKLNDPTLILPLKLGLPQNADESEIMAAATNLKNKLLNHPKKDIPLFQMGIVWLEKSEGYKGLAGMDAKIEDVKSRAKQKEKVEQQTPDSPPEEVKVSSAKQEKEKTEQLLHQDVSSSASSPSQPTSTGKENRDIAEDPSSDRSSWFSHSLFRGFWESKVGRFFGKRIDGILNNKGTLAVGAAIGAVGVFCLAAMDLPFFEPIVGQAFNSSLLLGTGLCAVGGAVLSPVFLVGWKHIGKPAAKAVWGKMSGSKKAPRKAVTN